MFLRPNERKKLKKKIDDIQNKMKICACLFVYNVFLMYVRQSHPIQSNAFNEFKNFLDICT